MTTSGKKNSAPNFSDSIVSIFALDKSTNRTTEICNQNAIDAHLEKAKSLAKRGYIIVFIFLVPAAAWMVAAPISSAVIANGFVKVDTNRAVVQHLEGGIVRAVYVRDGQHVRAGDVLVELGDVSVNADQTRLIQRLQSERISQARLESEQVRKNRIDFQTDLVEASKTNASVKMQLDREVDLFEAKLSSLRDSIKLYEAQKYNISKEIFHIKNQIENFSISIEKLNDELLINKKLLKDGWVSEIVIIRLESTSADYRAKLEDRLAELVRANQRIGELNIKINQLETEYKQSASNQLKTTITRIQEIEQELRKASDASKRQSLTAPASGEIIGLRVNAPGGILNPRETIAEIVPDNPLLVVEAQLRPEDISRINKGQNAKMMFTSFGHGSTDMVNGTVSYISADRLIQKNTGSPYYVINIDVDTKSMKSSFMNNSITGIRAGMPVEVYLQGITRTPIEYLTEPVNKIIRRAGRDN